MSKKVVSPAAINALKEALSSIYWYKKDLRSFLTHSIRDSRILKRLNWGEYKRNVVSDLIEYLLQNQEGFQQDILSLMSDVVQMKDFSHLERLEDGKEKAKVARETVQALEKLYKTHEQHILEQETIDMRRKQAEDKRVKRKAVSEKIEDLRNQYYQLLGSTNPQSRGYQLEIILRELFTLFDLDPKASFKIQGEQIDGAFTFDNIDYLLEAKWKQEPTGIQDLYVFDGKITRKLDNTLGLFISINGFSTEAVWAYSSNKKMMMLMDGGDLMAVLEERIDLRELLLLKRKSAAQKGNIYLQFKDIMV